MHRFESTSIHDAPDPAEVKKRLEVNRSRAEATAAQSSPVEDTASQLVIKPFLPQDLPESPLFHKNRTSADADYEVLVVDEEPVSAVVEMTSELPAEQTKPLPVAAEEMVVLKQTEGGRELRESAETNFQMDDAPAVPATAPEAKTWYAKVWDRAKAYVAPLMGRFNMAGPAPEVPKPVTAELQALRTQRAEWHDLAQQLFSEDKAVSAKAKEAVKGKVLDLGHNQRYTIERALGQGGFGSAFVAVDEAGIKRVVKLSKPFNRQDMFAAGKQLTPQEAVKASTARSLVMEVAALRRLNKLGEQNPGPALVDAQFIPDPRNPDQRIAAVVMEYVDGVSLNKFALNHQREPLVMVDAIKQLAAALEVAHREGVVHSDVKPANVMVDQQGKVKLIDFGTAVLPDLRAEQADHSPQRVINAPDTKKKLPQSPVYAQEAAQIYSPSYAIQTELASPTRDRYSVGRTMQFMIFGRDRFKDPKAMKELEPTLSYPLRELAGIAKKLVRDDPKERISLAETRHLLEQLAATEEQIEDIQEKIASGQ